MARYRKIDPRIWNDGKFRRLSDRGKLAFLFVLTHPHLTSLGAMRATLDGLASELGWPARQFRDAIGEAIVDGMVEASEDACYVGLPNFLRYNEPEGPNSVTKAWREALDLIPECEQKQRLIARCREYLDGKSHAFRRAMGDAIWHAFAMPCPIPEQEPEPEQEQEKISSSSAAPGTVSSNGHGSPAALWPSPEALVALYNDRTPSDHPKVVTLSDERRRKCRKYLKQFPEQAWWEQVFEEVGASELLLHGSPERPSFRGDLDWLLQKGQNGTENCVKTYEGKYRNRAVPKGAGARSAPWFGPNIQA